MVKKNFLFFLFLFSITVSAQITLDRQVIGSAGGTGSIANWGSIDYTVGECIVTTDSILTNSPVKYLTQGFQQPSDVDTVFLDSIRIEFYNSPCIGRNCGSAKIVSSYKKWPGKVIINVQYQSSASSNFTTYVKDTIDSVQVKPIVFSNNCIPLGTYKVYITINGNVHLASIVISENQIPCLAFYNGITPNGDGANDIWKIDGAEFYPNNKVSVFNRWGDLIWQKEGYDNINVFWDGKSSKGNELPDATYFYIFEVDNAIPSSCDGCKGWIELTH